MLSEEFKRNPVAFYLMAAYAYYVEDSPIMEDLEFDALSQYLLENWDTIEHIHKGFISVGDLEAGTFLGRYPKRVPWALYRYRTSLI
jgi:hypothetical protein